MMITIDLLRELVKCGNFSIDRDGSRNYCIVQCNDYKYHISMDNISDETLLQVLVGARVEKEVTKNKKEFDQKLNNFIK